MNHMEFTGKTIEDAVQKALKELDLQKHDIKWETLEENADAVRIRVYRKEPIEQAEEVTIPEADPVVPGEAPQKPFVADVPIPGDGLKVDDKPEV